MSDHTTERGYTRRTLLRAGTAGAAAATIGGASGTAVAQESPYGGWLSNVSNFDGTTVDMTGKDTVTVAVGAEGNGANYAFAPPAIKVDPGTSVVWKWTGKGGSHNVVDKAGNFKSELVAEKGHTFTQTFEEAGVRKYYCLPHKGLGMKGVVAVGDTAKGEVVSPGGGESGDDPSDGGGGDAGGGGDGSGGDGNGGGAGGSGGDGGGDAGGGDGGSGGDGDQTAATPLAAQTLLAMLVLGFLSPLVFLFFVRRKLGRRPSEN